MSWLLLAAGVVFGVAALLTVVRLTLGPTMLDRAIALDVMVAVVIGAIAVDAAVDRDTDSATVLLVATLLGFVASVSIARFTPGSDDVDAQDPTEAEAGDPVSRTSRGDMS